ncbi:MAG: OmpA family protein [Phycisphaera sp.]|nr:OmpA family protein [Phycisphaera sp.]
MRRTILLFAPVALLAAGCVPQEKYDDLLSAYRAKEQQVVSARQETERMRSNEAAVRRQMQDYVEKLEQAEVQIGGQNGEISNLRGQFEVLLEQVQNLDFGPMNPELNEKLLRLASENPDLLDYDEVTGTLQFASDVTFAMGSVDLSPDALNAVKALADILDEGDGLVFEIQVLGHTDNVRLRSGSIYRSNVQLSAQRAISVRNAMVKDGVSPDRILIGGFGEFRPLVENGRRGAAANRRVEIRLAPMPVLDIEAVEVISPDPAPAAEQPSPAPVEDEPLK